MAGLGITLRAPSSSPIPIFGPKIKRSSIQFSLNSVRFQSTFPNFGRSLRTKQNFLVLKASVDSVEYIAEPATNVKFAKDLTVPCCSNSLTLLGTGYREKVFAIIGVKVYAAGFYVQGSICEKLSFLKGKSATDILSNSSFFKSMYNAPSAKSLSIKLVRDVDGKTFWNALNDVITPRIQNLNETDENALSIFRTTFLGRDLKEGTYIFLTWVGPTKLLVSISADGLPSKVDAQIESAIVNFALFDGFFGNSPVSPTLKSSVAEGIQKILG